MSKQLDELIKDQYEQIISQKEEILKAFIAKFGLQPDECMQIVQHSVEGTKWWIQKKDD